MLLLYGLFCCHINYFTFMMGQWASFVELFLGREVLKKLHPENLTAMVLIECLVTLAVCFVNVLMYVFPVCLLFE